MIPLYKMEEHRDGFYVWRHAIQQGFLPPKENCLIHVDHHDDMEDGYYDHDFTHPMESMEAVRAFTDRALGIADFIIPAFYEGIFSEMLNFKGIFPTPGKEERFAVKASDSHTLKVTPFLAMVHQKYRDSADSPYCFFTVRTESFMPFSPEKPCVLDIDLDYFCWDNTLSSGKQASVEISREDYEAFTGDRLHPMRILAKRLVQAVEQDGRYYLRINDQSGQPKETALRHVDRRIGGFIQWLRENRIQPRIIDICRSRISGYCPADRWEYIENQLTARLGELYPLEMMDIPMLLGEEG